MVDYAPPSDDSNALASFRHAVSRRARESSAQWDDSRRLIESERWPATLGYLRQRTQGGRLPPLIEQRMLLALRPDARRVQELDGEMLKALTGLPPTKAVRALCLYFDLVPHPAARWPVPRCSGEDVERLVHPDRPFDLLLQADVASVLDLGAGDLSFATELTEHYLPSLKRQGRSLIFHGLDRLHPTSKLGGPLHPDRPRVHALQERLGESFGFFGGRDMFALRPLDDQGQLAPRYTVVTCWAPATPTFAYEPSRLSDTVIADDLRRTKGAFQQTRYDGEPALEVRHGERTLLFPSWKFEIVGPLALLGLAARRGALCVFGAVDAQVFWELLAQLLDGDGYRPADRPFGADNLHDIFGDLYETLERLPIGHTADLADHAQLRASIPGTERGEHRRPYAFRRVWIRRGATFPGVPASSTARKFSAMSEEVPPWFLTLIPA